MHNCHANKLLVAPDTYKGFNNETFNFPQSIFSGAIRFCKFVDSAKGFSTKHCLFLYEKICNTELDVFQNSKPIFDMVGPVTKTQQVKSAMVLPLNTQAACKRKAVFAATGKQF